MSERDFMLFTEKPDEQIAAEMLDLQETCIAHFDYFHERTPDYKAPEVRDRAMYLAGVCAAYAVLHAQIDFSLLQRREREGEAE